MSSVAGSRKVSIPFLVFAACVVLNLALSFVGWRHNILEAHEFRQAQTAMTADAIRTEGWNLAYPLPLFGPPWSAPMEFPWYEIIVAKFANAGGWATEPTGRAVSLIALYLTLPACFALLGRLGVPPRRRWLCLALLLVTPIFWYYSRSVMIESTALCASMWFLWAYCHAVERPRPGFIAAALVFGSVAGLAKATTLAVFLAPALWFTLVRLSDERADVPDRRARWWAAGGTALGITALVLVATQAWVWYGDHIKAENPLATFLRSGPMAAWNYGPLAMRFTGGFWHSIAVTVNSFIVPAWSLALAVIAAAFSSGRARLQLLGLLGCYGAGVLVFANLYAVHDYYHYAGALFLVAAVFVAGSGFVDAEPTQRWRGLVVIGALVALLAADVNRYRATYFQFQARGDLPPPEIARLLSATTPPDTFIVLYGYDWNPVIPHFAQRRAIMISTPALFQFATQEQVLRPLAGDIGAVVLHGDAAKNAAIVDEVQRLLDLPLEPALSSDDTQVYYPVDVDADARAKLRTMSIAGFKVTPPKGSNGVSLHPFDSATMADPSGLDVVRPAPAALRTHFGINTALVDDVPVLAAPAPTEVVVPLTAAQSRIQIGFGLEPASYADGNSTDGVEFRIELHPPHGRVRTLFHRLLAPLVRNEDRGTQKTVITLPRGTVGQLVFRTLPGPADNTSFDWSYWSEIHVE